MAFVKSTNSKSLENRLTFKRTSSFNKYFICHYCDRKFDTRDIIADHIQTCLNHEIHRTCKWCKIVFKNRGNLVTHAYYIHNDSSFKSKPQPNTCNVCDKGFSNTTSLKYHIRRVHYNLVAKIPFYNDKKIDQIWFERVQNTDTIVEMKKSGHNMLLIRKLNDSEDIQTEECKEVLDLTPFYPTGNRVTSKTCEICSKVILERDFKKHYDEKHGEVKKHHCNKCDMTFKRSYFFIRHKCNKTKKTRRKRKLKIDKVESLNPIPV